MKSAIGVALGSLCLSAFAALSALAAQETPKPSPTPTKPALTVSVTSASATQAPKVISANGSLAAWQEALVGAEANGLKITRVHVNVGDRVKRGDMLATLNSETIQAELAQAQALLDEVIASAQETQLQAERAKSLQAQGFFSAAQLSQSLATNAAAQARVQSARSAVQLHTARLSQTQIRAPDAGVISARQATEGSVVMSGTELFRLIRQGRLEWRAEVTAAEIGRIPVGAPVQVTAASGQALQGKVRMIAPSLDMQTRNAIVYVDLTSPTGSARPGMYAKGEITTGQSEAMTLPQTAVVVRDGFSYVYVVGDDQKVSVVKVQTGRFIADRVEVLSGLPAGAKVVISGGAFLNHGDTVRVVSPPPATGK